MKESYIEFRADPRDCNAFIVERDHKIAAFIIRVPSRWHCWELLDPQKRVVAQFRASRAFPWLVLFDSQGQRTSVPHNMLCGIGRLEWSLSKSERLRWSRIDQTMVYVRSQRVLLPELVKLTSVPKMSLTSNSGFQCTFKWQCPALIAERICFHVVISTAFIAMWRWSREPEKVIKAKRSMHNFFMELFVSNLNAQLLPTILAQSQHNLISTYAGFH